MAAAMRPRRRILKGPDWMAGLLSPQRQHFGARCSLFSFWHYPHYGNQAVRRHGGTPGASVRDGDWKLIRFFEDGHEELYNLKEDIGETTNLADTEPEKLAELSANLTARQEEIEGLGVSLYS